MKNGKILNIFIDTNVLANFFTGQKPDIDCLQYIFSKRKKEHLFTSSLALVQVAQVLQTGKGKKRKKFDVEQTNDCLTKLISKFNILELSQKDVTNSFELDPINQDVEDRVQYKISQKVNCKGIITNDISHYNNFLGIRVFSPKDIPYMKKHLN